MHKIIWEFISGIYEKYTKVFSVFLKRGKLKMKMDKNGLGQFLELCYPLIVERIGTENLNHFEIRTKIEFQKLQPNAPIYKHSINRNNFLYAVFSVSIFKVLTNEFQFEKEKAIELLTVCIDKATKQRLDRSVITRFMLRMSKYEFMKNMVIQQMLAKDEPKGWIFKKMESQAYWAFEVRQCGLVEYFKEQGVPEICPAFCKADYTIATYMHGLTFKRNNTLANGAEICDFCYYLEDK